MPRCRISIGRDLSREGVPEAPVIGPLTSGIATVALCVGYIAGWPANAMAILASIAGGGSVTGIIGRLTAKVGVR